MIPTLRFSSVRRLLGVAAVAALTVLAACSGAPARNDVPASGEMLESSLSVAAAALAAGQPEVARRLYLSLAERFADAPEPMLGLAYIAFHSGDLPAAEERFQEAAARARKASPTRAEAWLGAGRAALARNRVSAAREHFERARKDARDTPSAPWIANGLAVVAAIESDYREAESEYAEALRLSPGDPRITANLVRTLVRANRIEDAARAHADRPVSFWADDDGRTLLDLIEEARHERRRRGAADGGETRPGIAWDPFCIEQGGDWPNLQGAGGARVASAHGFAPGLALRLSAFGPPAERAGDGVGSLGEDAPLPVSDYVLRLAEWPGPRAPLQVASCHGTASVPSPNSNIAKQGGPQQAALVSVEAAADERQRSNPESRAVEEGMLDHRAPTTLTLGIGQNRRLRLAHRATSVVVAAPEIADVQLSSPNMLHILGRGAGRTSVSVLSDDWVEEQMVLVVVDLDPLRSVLAGEPGLEDVQARQLARGVELNGKVASAEAADRALRLAATTLPEGTPIQNDLRITTPQQVNLEVQIAEVNRSVTEDLGINWESFGVKNAERFGFRIGRVMPSSPGEGFGLDAFPPTTIAGRDIASSLFFGSKGPLGQFRAMIDALATAGLANVLARPNVTAVSGEAASFFSGGEYPLPTGFEDGVIIFEYKKYGVLLDFVPTVVDANRIVLTVRPEVSEPSLNQSVQIVGVDIPVINVRRAETTVEVGDGESIVIAGLFRNASNTVETGVTGLKDMPVLGTLFGKTSIRSDELELIVIVTARLVHARTDLQDASAPPPSASRRINGYHY